MAKDRTTTITRIARPADVSRGAVSVDSSGKTIRIEWAKLTPPTNVYDADFAWAVERHGTISLFFAKEHVSGKGLRTRMEIRVAPEPFVLNFWDDSVKFYRDLKAGGSTSLPPAPPTRAQKS